MDTAVIERRQFVPKNLNPENWPEVDILYRDLLARPIAAAAELQQWLADFSELTCVLAEFGGRRWIDKSCHTDDPDVNRRFLFFIEQLLPKLKPLDSDLQKKFLACTFADELKDRKFEVMRAHWRADVELFREENVPLQTEETKLATEYNEICGAMTVNFRGQELTLQQAAKHLEDPDRQKRQEAWELSMNRRYADHPRIEDIFDKLLDLRARIARNVGFDNYRQYVWKSYKRFDYSPEQCLAFADAIARTCVPIVRELDRQRKAALGIDALRPWDLMVDPRNRAPLRPFAEQDVDALVRKTKTIFDRLSPALADDFDSLRLQKNLDLASRKGKQPGGYMATLEESRQAFIFMNAAGIQEDVETLLHEGGHAFHYLASSRVEPLTFMHRAPMEFNEVASMSMELLGSDHFDVFYNDADAARAKRTMLERIVKFLPYMAMIDSIQQWMYTHPGHTRDQRKAEWLRLDDRFAGRVDWTAWEHVRASYWEHKLHLFEYPFYYIEYGIAQLGALQIWVKSRQDPHAALANYRAALKLGGTRSLPELFRAAGIVFDFSEKTLGPLMDAVGEELRSLGE
jgi:oligoendopeptidase F